MPTKIEKDYNDPPKPKRKKEYAIYYRYTDEAWRTLVERNSYITYLIIENNWTMWKKYATEKSRDEALKTLNKNKVNWKSLFPDCTYEFQYEYCCGEDLNEKNYV